MIMGAIVIGLHGEWKEGHETTPMAAYEIGKKLPPAQQEMIGNLVNIFYTEDIFDYSN